MAKDDQNKDKEEDDFFGDDEDFGLPELDYDALGDVDSESENDTSFDISDDDFSSDFGEETSDEDFGDMDDVFGEEDKTTDDEEKIEEEPAAVEESASDSNDDFYGEESFDEFDSSEDASMDDISDEELSELDMEGDEIDDEEFKDFESDLMEGEDDFSTLDVPDDFSSGVSEEVTNEEGDSSSKGKFAKIVIVGILIFAALGGIFIWLAPSFTEDNEELADNTETEEPKKEPESPEEPEEQVSVPVKGSDEGNKDTNDASTTEGSTTRPTNTQKANNKTSQPRPQTTTPGQVNALTERTNNYYIVIASFVDEDLALDHSRKLAQQGKSSTVIPPFGQAITTRVAIKGYSSLGQAQNELGSFQGEYGQDIWILKY